MHIVYIGDFTGKTDEGMRRLSQTISEKMSAHHQVLTINTRAALVPRVLWQIRQTKPDIIHYITGPTIRSLATLALYKTLLPQCQTVASAARPFFGRMTYNFLNFLRPDLMLTQDIQWEQLFRKQGMVTEFVPNGVDLDRFKPAEPAQKTILRRKYGLPENARLVLHVGHLRHNRNLEIFCQLQKSNDLQVVIVTGTAFAHEKLLYRQLVDAGCILLINYLPNIEEVYACADAYVFPVQPLPKGQLPHHYNQVGVIDMPLSVLEAMASNLPVITTRFSALERILVESQSLRWFDGSAEDCLQQLNTIELPASTNRAQVQSMHWPCVIEQLELIYTKLKKQH